MSDRSRRRAARTPPAAPAPRRPGLISHEQNPSSPDVLDDARLFVVVKTWMDADIIGAVVKNALVQGAERVYIVDNASTDSTVHIARAAGADIAEVYETPMFDDRLAQTLMNAVVARESLALRDEYIWWMHLDSDELPEGPDGSSVREHLSALDHRFRVVGAQFFNHFPSGKPEYVPGFHPIDFQKLCLEFTPALGPCSLRHWKHPLQRFDRRAPFLISRPGAHSVLFPGTVVEPDQGIVVHHFQYRDEELTRSKLDLACGGTRARVSEHENLGFRGFAARRRSLDAVYHGRWDALEPVETDGEQRETEPKAWPGLDDVRRWYSEAELSIATGGHAHVG